jgi:Holliday junction resolvase RusA-like endonuclease
MKLFIDYTFPNLNEYINAERANKYLAAKIKREEKDFIEWTVKGRYEGGYPVTLHIRPHYKDKRQDLDNFRMKGLIDGLVSAGVIKNDNLNCINKIILDPVFTSVPGVEIEITETEERE